MESFAPLSHAAPSLQRLSDLRRRYVAEETELLEAVEQAQEELDAWTSTRRDLHLRGLRTPDVDGLCEELETGLTQLVNDLLEVRSAVLGLDEEIDDLVARELAVTAVRPAAEHIHGVFIGR